MVNEVTLYVCDKCNTVMTVWSWVGGNHSPQCIGCMGKMKKVTFVRKTVEHYDDSDQRQSKIYIGKGFGKLKFPVK